LQRVFPLKYLTNLTSKGPSVKKFLIDVEDFPPKSYSNSHRQILRDKK